MLQTLNRTRPNGTLWHLDAGDLLDEMTRGFGFASGLGTDFDVALDVVENANEWLVRAELPGVGSEDVDVSVTGNVLTIRGEKRNEELEEGASCRRTERRYGKFVRSLEFPTDLATQAVEARARNGVLSIRLPKAETSRPRSVAIKVE
jgi:HSP20 family protein